jgi:hypothetical protein
MPSLRSSPKPSSAPSSRPEPWPMPSVASCDEPSSMPSLHPHSEPSADASSMQSLKPVGRSTQKRIQHLQKVSLLRSLLKTAQVRNQVMNLLMGRSKTIFPSTTNHKQYSREQGQGLIPMNPNERWRRRSRSMHFKLLCLEAEY